jgi:hypothetical protein
MRRYEDDDDIQQDGAYALLQIAQSPGTAPVLRQAGARKVAAVAIAAHINSDVDAMCVELLQALEYF